MKKIIVSALILTTVLATGITGYASYSRSGQLARPCELRHQDVVKESVPGAYISDAAAFAGKRVLAYQKASPLEKKAAIESAKDDTASTKTDTSTAKADTASVNTDTASVEAVAASVETAAVSNTADAAAVANQALCPHGYCIDQGVCPYSDCPYGGYCVNNDGYQYQDCWNNGDYVNSGGDTYVNEPDYGSQTSDYTCYQGGGQGYGYQGGCGQGYGYGQGNGYGYHHGGRGHHWE